MEILYLVGFVIVAFIIGRLKREFFPNSDQKTEDYFSELSQKHVEISLRTKLLEHAKKTQNRDLMDLGKNFSLSYKELQKIAKKHNVK